jgi:hypothetical protein
MIIFDSPTMPGSYFPELDQSSRPSLHLTTTNARPPLFLPPTSPSATSSLSRTHSPTAQTFACNDFGSRKRARRNDYSSESILTTPRQATARTKINASSARSSAIYSPDTESPASFINTSYNLAGGLDTLSAARLEDEERREADLRELDYRPNRMTLPARQESISYFPRTPALPVGEGLAGHKRGRSNDQPGWGKVVVNLVGGVAGKVFNFCWNSAFRGFQAGGGQAYRMSSNTPTIVEQSTWMSVGEKDDVFNKNYEAGSYQHMAPVPGQFPEDGFIHDYMSHPQAYRADELSTPVPYGDEGRSTLKGNWVLVSNTDGAIERDQSPLCSSPKIPRARSSNPRRPPGRTLLSTAGSRPRLTPSRPSLAGSPGSYLNRPASFASPRGSPGRSRGSEADPVFPGKAERRRSKSSMSSPRRTAEGASKQSFDTPASPDVQRFEKKIRRKERKEDESIQRLNKQLQDMIKEGKEALGTTVEIEDDPDEDEGYGEGTEVMAASKW